MSSLARRIAGWALAAGLAAGGAGASAQTITFTPVGKIAGPIDLVRAEGAFAYVTRGGRLTVYDLADPSAPARRGSYELPEKVWGFTVSGSLAYLAAGHSGLWIIDVSDPQNPALRGALKTPGQSKNVAVSGRHAVLADHMSGVDVIDISDLAAPAAVGSVYTDGYARDVAMFDSRAYAVDHPAGFYVLDLTAADPLQPVGALQSAAAPRHVEILPAQPDVALLVGGVPYDPLRVLRAADRPDDPRGSLQLYDVSDPSAPALITTWATPGNAQRAALDGALAWVADGPGGLTVVDLSDPANPQLVGSYPTPRAARDVAVADTAVLVLDGTIRRGSHTHEDGDVIILRRTGG